MIRIQAKPCTFLRRFIKQGNEVRKMEDEITCEFQKSLNIFDEGVWVVPLGVGSFSIVG